MGKQIAAKSCRAIGLAEAEERKERKENRKTEREGREDDKDKIFTEDNKGDEGLTPSRVRCANTDPRWLSFLC